jgi:hypothetical protein
MQTVFTKEDKNTLKILVEELPELRLVVEELIKTVEILGDLKLMKSIRASLKDAKAIDY